jgi:hypothetical protein
VNVGGDTVLLDENREEDEVRQSTANPMVRVARWIACWRGAMDPPELTDAATSKREIQRPGGVIACEAWQRSERGGIYRWGRLARGARVARAA